MPTIRNFASLCLASIVTLAAGTTQAQTLSNPDISVIGDTRLVFRNGIAAEAEEAKEIHFEFTEVELNFNAYLNPYMRADVTTALHEIAGEVEFEEAAITVLRGLPWSMQFKTGKYFLDMGKLNTQHPHQWPWLELPLMHRTVLGEEGLRSLGANLSTLQAIGDNAVTFSLNAFQGDAFAVHSHEHADETTGRETTSVSNIMYSGRLSLFRDLAESWWGEFGVSGLYGEYDDVEGLKTTVANADLKIKWRPDKYRAFHLVAEVMTAERDVAHEGEAVEAGYEIDTVRSLGAFGAFQVRFRRLWDVGTFADYTEDAEVEDAATSAFGGFLGYMPAEETARFSVVYRYETSDLYDYDNHSVNIQFLWALGPHRPHQF